MYLPFAGIETHKVNFKILMFFPVFEKKKNHNFFSKTMKTYLPLVFEENTDLLKFFKDKDN
jgi:hypothetical protein